MSAVLTTAPAPAGTRDGTRFTGTGRLTRFVLRRDRTRIGVWALSIGALIGYFGLAIPVVYPDAASRQTRAAIMRDPSGALMTGPGYGLDDYTFGAMISNEMLGMIAVATALMSIFLVVRHTRLEEETGRAELVRAGVVGHEAPLTAALVDMLVANMVVGLVLLGALAANGLAVADSAAVALGAALVGIVFGCVAAVTAQLTEHARGASGLAGAALGLAYVLRGVGDAQQLGGSALSWASPIGWVQQARAFVDLRWWPMALCAALAAVLLAAAFALHARRDLGAGLLASRAGRDRARPALVGVAGLTARLERASVLGWAAGLFVFAALTGSMAEAIVEGFEEQPQLAEVFGGLGGADVVRSTLAAFLTFFAMAVAVQAVVAVNRLRREEGEGRTGALVAAGVSRPRWLGGTLAVVAGQATVLLLVSGLGLGLGAAGSVDEPSVVLDFTLASLVHLPVVLCFAALAALAYGAAARTAWVWLLLVASILVGLYGGLFQLPDAVLDQAPFALAPALPGAGFEAAPVVGLVLVAAVTTAGALAAFRARDLEG